MNFTLIFPITLGWLAGMFINYLSDVLPHTRRFSQPACRDCQTPISWIDYVTLRACRNCGVLRSLRTWIVQFVMTASYAYFWLFPVERLGLPLGMIVLVYFGIITVIDLEHRLILHPTSIAGAILGLVVGISIYSKKYSFLLSLGYSLAGGLIGFGIMYLLYLFGVWVARLRARRMQAAGQATDDEEALGGGDVYLLGILGLMLGPAVISALVYGVLLGGLVSLLLVCILLIRRRYLADALMSFIPYGPYFIIGAFYMLFLFKN